MNHQSTDRLGLLDGLSSGKAEVGAAARFKSPAALLSSSDESSSAGLRLAGSTSTGCALAFSSTKFRSVEVAGDSFSERAGTLAVLEELALRLTALLRSVFTSLSELPRTCSFSRWIMLIKRPAVLITKQW